MLGISQVLLGSGIKAFHYGGQLHKWAPSAPAAKKAAVLQAFMRAVLEKVFTLLQDAVKKYNATSDVKTDVGWGMHDLA